MAVPNLPCYITLPLIDRSTARIQFVEQKYRRVPLPVNKRCCPHPIPHARTHKAPIPFTTPNTTGIL
ncbi:uncharacterized protein SPAR_E00620 [Saccharomyces paradoxus]|uniref:Uncharacterized protein n=1 Tax=Saccharomyces paradoxus TaxID=27291 RepID=A0A8B8UPV2_SACPA|nr:uncharacterized protein SPAR_E00620 [Saccharomyces paradoxus]QHS72773.1 hypothetical protein SPAR_E00620 [Saccharomyces paradoxus]